MQNDGYGYNGGGPFPFPVQQPQAPQASSAGQGPDWGGNFSRELNGMLAPYQQIAQRISSPYATMSPNSWLAQNHPQLAGTLDNAFLGMGMTPQAQGPEGFGGGVSRMMQGLVGAQQFRHTQAMDTAMLPYKMAMGQLQAADTMSQINERNAMLPFRQAQEKRYDAQSSMYYDRMAQGDRSKAMAGPDLIDDSGKSWSRIFDPVAGKVRNFNPELQKYSDELPTEQQPSFTKSEKQNRMSTPGGLMGEIVDMRMSSDPAIKARGDQMAKLYTGMQGTIAGQRAGATQDVTQPVKNLDSFLQNERAQAYKTLPAPAKNIVDFVFDYAGDPTWGPEIQKNAPNAMGKFNKVAAASRQKMDIDLSNYEKAARSKPNEPFAYQQYAQNPSQYDGTPSAIAPSPSATPSNSASTWTPK